MSNWYFVGVVCLCMLYKQMQDQFSIVNDLLLKECSSEKFVPFGNLTIDSFISNVPITTLGIFLEESSSRENVPITTIGNVPEECSSVENVPRQYYPVHKGESSLLCLCFAVFSTFLSWIEHILFFAFFFFF